MIIVTGELRLLPGTAALLMPHMLAMLAASRAEPGCLGYSYAFDLVEPDLVRVNEAWESQARLDAHLATPHLAAWRAVLKEIGIAGRALRAFETDAGVPF